MNPIILLLALVYSILCYNWDNNNSFKQVYMEAIIVSGVLLLAWLIAQLSTYQKTPKMTQEQKAKRNLYIQKLNEMVDGHEASFRAYWGRFESLRNKCREKGLNYFEINTLLENRQKDFKHRAEKYLLNKTKLQNGKFNAVYYTYTLMHKSLQEFNQTVEETERTINLRQDQENYVKEFLSELDLRRDAVLLALDDKFAEIKDSLYLELKSKTMNSGLYTLYDKALELKTYYDSIVNGEFVPPTKDKTTTQNSKEPSDTALYEDALGIGNYNELGNFPY